MQTMSSKDSKTEVKKSVGVPVPDDKYIEEFEVLVKMLSPAVHREQVDLKQCQSWLTKLKVCLG